MAIKGKIDPKEIGQSATNTGLYLNDLKDNDELKFRVIGDIQSGYQYFQNYKKEDGTDGVRPVRSEEFPEVLDNPSTQKWDGQESSPKQFLAMAIYDIDDKQIKLFQVTKKDLLKGLMEVELDDMLGEIQDYNFKATKTGQKLETEYSLTRYDKSELTTEMLKLHEEANVNLNDYMSGTGGIGEKKSDQANLENAYEEIAEEKAN